MQVSEDLFRRISRSQIPAASAYAYLDHASLGPIPATSVAAVLRTLCAQSEHGSLKHGLIQEEVEIARDIFARLVGVSPKNIAAAGATSSAISKIVLGLDWRPGDQVVVADIDFPSIVMPWRMVEASGVEVRSIACPAGVVDYKEMLDACTTRTRVIAVSWVQFTSGYKIDLMALGEACRSRGILLVIDIMQGVGVSPINLSQLPVDAAATQCYKWLLGPQGVGWLYLSPRLLENLKITSVGSRSLTPRESFCDHTFALRQDATRHENGILDFHGIAGARASIEMLENIGIETIAEISFALAERLRAGLVRRGCTLLGDAKEKARRGSIVSFQHPTLSSSEVRKALLAKQVVTSVREGYVRVSPHHYNTEAEIDRLLSVLDGEQTKPA